MENHGGALAPLCVYPPVSAFISGTHLAALFNSVISSMPFNGFKE